MIDNGSGYFGLCVHSAFTLCMIKLSTRFGLLKEVLSMTFVVQIYIQSFFYENLHFHPWVLARLLELAPRCAHFGTIGTPRHRHRFARYGQRQNAHPGSETPNQRRRSLQGHRCTGGKVILVGHSKNGIVISQAAEYRPQKIEKLVYLAAYLIPNGKTQREYSMQDTAGVLKPYVHVHADVNATTLDPAIYREGLYADCDENIVQLANVLLSAEPIETGITPLQLSDENFGSVPRVYIECTLDKAVTPFIQQKMYTELACEKVYQMETSHSPFFSKPQELVEILVGL
jgi:hypothetical protein